MHKKILAVFAHPDDEAFGPGGTLAKYAHEGVDVHLLSATKGEAGQMDEKVRLEKSKIHKKEIPIHEIREEELLKSAKILGVKRVEFLDYCDGDLCNNIYHDLAGKIMKKIESFKPQIILTAEQRGVSGHLDHIAVSMITTYAYLHTKDPKKLYYHCLTKKIRNSMKHEYFIYFPEGYKEDEITTRIDYSKYQDLKVQAMKQHKSQMKDVTSILERYKDLPKTDNFILQYHRNIKTTFPETDLFAGID
jgi:N-acetylglucosamine malate deacetylase 2